MISISEPPKLGVPVHVNLSFSTPTPKGLEGKDLRYSASIDLPPKVYEVIEGRLEQSGNLTAGFSTLDVTLKSIRETGSGQIYGNVSLIAPDGKVLAAEYDNIFIKIARDSAMVSNNQSAFDVSGYPVLDGNNPNNLVAVIPYDKAPPRGPLLTPPILRSSSNASAQSISVVGEPKSETSPLGFTHPLTVQGRFNTYISQNQAGHKFDDEPDVQPIVWGWVNIYDTNNNLLGTGLTGIGNGQPYGQNAGEYSIAVENPYPLGIKVMISPESSAAVVYRDLWNNSYGLLYIYNPVPFSQPILQSIDLTPADFAPNYMGAWRIYESLVNDVHARGAWNFLVNSSWGPHWIPPQGKVYYPVTPLWFTNPPFYDSWTGTMAIYLDDDGQTRGLDIVQHEYGHFIMHDVMYGYSPTSPIQPATHYFFAATSTGIAWSEGWADFFPLVVQNDAIFDNGPAPVDRADFENQDWLNPNLIWDGSQWRFPDYGDSVEGRVAGALWDIYDSNSEPYDGVSNRFDAIWAAFTGSSSSVRTFAGYWDNLKAQFASDQVPPARALFQNTIAYPELRLYLTTNVNPPSSGTVDRNPSGSPGYQYNQQPFLTGFPATGYHFSNWSGDANGSSNPIQMTMNFDKNVTANFASDTHTLTVSAGSGGTVTSPGIGQFGPYNHGQVVNISASPNSGYHFVNWTGDTGTIDNPNAASTTITMNGNYSIQANFAINTTYTLTISSTSGGDVTTPGEGAFGPYNHGQVVNLVATPSTGYHFVNWTGDTGTIDNPNSCQHYYYHEWQLFHSGELRTER